jgi:hypothetical protein
LATKIDGVSFISIGSFDSQLAGEDCASNLMMIGSNFMPMMLACSLACWPRRSWEAPPHLRRPHEAHVSEHCAHIRASIPPERFRPEQFPRQRNPPLLRLAGLRVSVFFFQSISVALASSRHIFFFF